MFLKKNKKLELDFDNLPKHVAFIMDGNGRWAKKRGLPRLMGHNAGTETLKKIVMESKKIGIQNITFYAFSTENWKRPEDEVNGLMSLLVKFIKSEIDEIHRNNIKINVLGDVSELPELPRKEVLNAIMLTENNVQMNFNIALNYGSRAEILYAVKKIVSSCENGELDINSLDESKFSKYLYTNGIPDPDIMVRTSGEKRLSNFMLWQLAYTEFFFLDIFWPDFNESIYREILIDYQKRHRRYGAV